MGLYLYAWPIQSCLVYFNRGIDPVVPCLLSLALASLAGLISWTLVEKPALNLARGRRKALVNSAVPG